MVGYNRRFAPSIVKVKTFLRAVNEPLMMHYRINAGFIKSDHWIQDRSQGGGRILGEVCHFVDLLTYLSDALPVRVFAKALPDNGKYHDDNISVMLEFANRSIGTIAYCANGDPSYPKERIEIFGGGVTAVIDDFKNLQLVRGRKSQTERSWLRKDKGHRGEWQAFASALKDGSEPIPYEEIVAGMLTTFAIEKSLQTGGSVDIDTNGFLEPLRS
jgi:predicted dehydrogenase